MSVTNGYCTLEELQSWNKASSTVDVPNQERAIGAAARGIDNWCRRGFTLTTSQARLFAPDNGYEFDFGPHHDLAEITALATDTAGNGTFDVTWAAGDYELLPLNPLAGPEQQPYTSIRSTGVRPFPYLGAGTTGRSGRVRITGRWGWPAVPAAVSQACLMQAARIFSRRESPQGVAGWNEFGVIRVGRTDPDVVELLDEYRLVRDVGFVRPR